MNELRLTKDTLIKAYAADKILEAVADLDNNDTEAFKGLLALNICMKADEVVALYNRNPEWGALAIETFLKHKAATITDDDVAELGTFDLKVGLRALNVYILKSVPSGSAIEKMVHAKKALGRKALDALLANPKCISVSDILTLRDLDYVWAGLAFNAFFEENRHHKSKIKIEDIVRLNEADCKWRTKWGRELGGRV
mmetsp:Transcript_1890/g.2088  ORF Transcript_1890/g.2088 Transcript_1890/m.2088 type:complete len:197 (-) Transcript_1890:893-1483(-)|eukprot:CAMPEP_0197849280 /NCGR_PEP_ID=MMETSP1438-20131217/11483_1 /TAXON_ID=1461541 /ORGANISM="Pterosperma sp., Strain CCMP1384" /LENGTH=196 /DNA_ID=CAMNT_0043461883 /DNA_START=289 /DNA_END=879 /DNA_ORIENTATION=+